MQQFNKMWIIEQVVDIKSNLGLVTAINQSCKMF